MLSREVVRTGGDDGRSQFRRRILQHRPLGEAEIRDPDGGEATGEPRLVPQPGDRVRAVGDLVNHRLEHATRSECAAHALQDHAVTARGVQVGEYQREGELPAVGSASQQRADRVADGFVMVGDQFHAVAHRDPDAADRVGDGSRGQSQRSAQGCGRRNRRGERAASTLCAGRRVIASDWRRLRTCSTATGRWPAAGWSAGSRRRRAGVDRRVEQRLLDDPVAGLEGDHAGEVEVVVVVGGLEDPVLRGAVTVDRRVSTASAGRV